MSFIKKIFGKKEDEIPEMHVKKNEPKPYWSKEHKCWMIPGQEEERIKELQESKKGPPKKLGVGIEKKESEETTLNNNIQHTHADENLNSITSQPNPRVNMIKKKPQQKQVVSNRYASALPSQNLDYAREDRFVRYEEVPETRMMPLEDRQAKLKINQVQEENNQLESNSKQTVGEGTENKNSLQTIESLIPCQNIKEIEKKLREEIEEEYKKKFDDMENFFTSEMIELTEALNFCQETHSEEIEIVKSQLNTFISQNLEYKIENEKIKDELTYREKELEQYQNLIENYKQSIDEPRTDYNLIHTSQDTNEEYILVNTKLEKLEYDKMMMNNDLIEARREASNLNMEKSFLEYKLKEQENNCLTMKENLIVLDKKIIEIQMQNTLLLKGKENLEKDNKQLDDIRKKYDKLLINVKEYNEEIVNLKSECHKLTKDTETHKKEEEIFKETQIRLERELEEKDANYSKVIKDLRSKIHELNLQCEAMQVVEINKNCLKDYEKKIGVLNENLIDKNRSISSLRETIVGIKIFAIENLKIVTEEITNENKIKKLKEVIRKLNESEDPQKEILLAMKTLSNEYVNRSYENQIHEKEKHLLKEEIKNLKLEVEILLMYKKEAIIEIEKLKDKLIENEEKLNSKMEEYKNTMNVLSDQNLRNQANHFTNIIQNLEERIEIEKNEKSEYEKINNLIQENINYLTEENTHLNSEILKLKFINEKLSKDYKDRESLLKQIMLESNLENSEKDEFDQSLFVEIEIANYIKRIEISKENLENECNILQHKKKFLEEELERKENSCNIIEEENKSSKKRINLLSNKNITLENQLCQLEESKSKLEEEILNLNNKINFDDPVRDKEIEELKEKSSKLREMLETTIIHYEQGIETLKSKQKQKLNEVKQNLENLNNQKETLKLENSNLINQTKDLCSNIENKNHILNNLENAINKILQEQSKYVKELNLPKNNNMNNISILSKIIEIITNDKTKFIDNLSSQSSQLEEMNKKLVKMENEQQVLIQNLNEKNIENIKLRNDTSDLEIQLEKYKLSYEEVNKNYEFLQKNFKSAEKLNEYQKKIQHLTEEKATLTQSHALIVDNLTNEIKVLNDRLNKKDVVMERIEKTIDINNNTKEDNIITTSFNQPGKEIVDEMNFIHLSEEKGKTKIKSKKIYLNKFYQFVIKSI
jgi:hypothetical protein